MNILVVGSGGREHALAWQLAQHGADRQIYVAPGNAGTELEPGVANVAIGADDIDGLIEFATREAIDLTVVGPEQPLVDGIADRFAAAGLRCFGPSAAAARLEGSKAFAKAFFDRHAIPTAAWRSFTEIEPALRWIDERGAPIVVKADGLAAGKGVIVAATVAEAHQAVRDMLGDARFGDAGANVVIEDFLEGEEASFIVMTDGEHVLPLASSQDHKARDDGDLGPNTGGMGAISPTPLIDAERQQRILDAVIAPTLAGLRTDGIRYCGFLYAGLMIAPDGTPKVLEFNCRLGDPETQPILARLASDLAEPMNAAIDGRLGDVKPRWRDESAVGVVLATRGYPGSYPRGDAIGGLDTLTANNIKVFHAGTELDGKTVRANGGRVLCVVARDASLRAARDQAYRAVQAIDWPGAHYRTDIGHRALDGHA
ncbi:MAG: phosphoribosylamine--glycine ligase [Pseudomonadota bacterium]